MPAPELQATYSTAAASALAAFLADTYALPAPLECTLLQRGFNDNFDVTDGEGRRYIARMSCRRARGAADVVSETAFLQYLRHAGVPVAAVVPVQDGAPFSDARMPEGPRAVVLFHYIEGRPVQWDSPADAKLQGATLARLHNAAETYTGRDDCAYRLDLDHLLHRPLQAILNRKALPQDDQTNLSALAARLAAAVSAFDHLTWTRCHGDCHGLNARIAENGPHAGEAVFFDFDDGGPGYLAYDLAVQLWARTFFNRKMQPQWHAFVEGYRTIRPITATDFSAVPVFAAIRHIWLLGEYTARIADWGSSAVPLAWIGNEIRNLQAWENDRLLPGLF